MRNKILIGVAILQSSSVRKIYFQESSAEFEVSIKKYETEQLDISKRKRKEIVSFRTKAY